MRRIVGDRVGLTHAIGIAPLRDDEVVERDAARVADREREALDRAADRPPHLDDGEAPRQQVFRLIGKQIAYALRPRPFGVVVVHAPHHLADFLLLAQLVVGGPQRMIEHDHAPRPALGLHQRLHLGIVDAPYLVLLEEIAHLGVVRDEAEAVLLEHEPIRVQPAVVHGHAARVRRAAGAHVERARPARIGEELFAVVVDVVERRLDRGGGVDFGSRGHGELLPLKFGRVRRRPARLSPSSSPRWSSCRPP